jgi:hypothetical protein
MKEIMHFVCEIFLSYLYSSFTCCKILQHGASGFSSHLKEKVQWIIIALKNQLPWPGLNLRTLGPIARTKQSSPATCHGDTWGRGGIAPTHS